jgi:hypothetical protein
MYTYNEAEARLDQIESKVRAAVNEQQAVAYQQQLLERRIATLEATLVNDNPTVRAVIEACKRIWMRWYDQEVL